MMTVQAGLRQLVDLAKADLSRRIGLDPDQIQVLGAEAVTWPDGSLGCPQPGMMYTQALVEGMLIRLAAGGRVYEYHGSRRGEPFLCDPAPPGAGPLPSDEI